MKKTLAKSIVAVLLTVCLTVAMFAGIPASAEEAAKTQCTYEEALQAFREVAYAYYMRGKNIQYNSLKKMGVFTPEEATSQNMNYMVCSSFSDCIYRELFGAIIPPYTYDLIDYAKDNVGRPEAIAYGVREDDGEFKVTFYDNGKKEELLSPKLADIVPHLQTGDVLTYTGHTIVVYDLIRDESGKIVDVMYMESMHGKTDTTSVVSKVSSITQGNVKRYGSANHYFYYNEGTIRFQELSKESYWPNLRGKASVAECSVVRFINKDANGNAVFNCLGQNWKGQNYTNEPIILNARARDRLNFSKLYVTKTVNVFEDSVVSEGDKLTYTITVKNNSEKDYSGKLTVKENVPKYTTYKSSTTANGVKKAKYDKKKKTVTWTVSNLKAGKSVKLKYTVSVNKKSKGKTVTSIGAVNNVSTAEINNPVGNNLTKKQKTKIKDAYKKLKSKYTGKKLINEIYKTALGKDLKLDKFKVSDVVVDTDKEKMSLSTLYLNKDSKFYNNVFAGYYNSLSQKGTTYDLKYWSNYESDEPRRADTVYEENFKTGDILIYNNTNDQAILKSGGPVIDITYENGEYAYIYIEGKGFVGVNLGADGKKGTMDDRNVFSSEYYDEAGLLASTSGVSEKTRKKMNFQTLIGKDNYVIMRPSLTMK